MTERVVNIHSSEEIVRLVKAAFGAPGDWGYESKEGKALYALYYTAARGRYFYFTRKSKPHPLADGWLISGVIMAPSAEEAQSKLNALLEKRKSTDRGSDFSFADLSTVEVPDHGVAAITIGSF